MLRVIVRHKEHLQAGFGLEDTMPRKAVPSFKETELTKGELRKLNALRKSVGDTISTRAFTQWLASAKKKARGAVDRNAELIASALETLAKAGKLRIRRGGYVVRRGRGRVIVTRARAE